MNQFEVVKWERALEGKREVYIHEDSEISQTGGRFFFLIESEEAGELGKLARQLFCKEMLASYHSFSQIRDTKTHLTESIQKANEALLAFFEENEIPGHQGLMVTVIALEEDRVYHFQIGAQPFIIWRNETPVYLGSKLDPLNPPSEEEISLRETMRLPIQSIKDDMLEIQETRLKNGDLLLITSSNLTLALSSAEQVRDLVEHRIPAEIRDEIKRAVEDLVTPHASAVLCIRANAVEKPEAPKTERMSGFKPEINLQLPTLRKAALLGGGVIVAMILIYVMTRIFSAFGPDDAEVPNRDGGESKPIAAAVDQPAGKVIWEKNMGAEVSSSPRVQNGVIYFGCKDGNLYALDAETGDLKWRFRTTEGIGSSPTLDDSLVYIGSYDYQLYAVSKETGALVWKYHTDARIVSSPVVAEKTVYVGSNDYKLHAVSTINGEKAWVVKTQNIVWASPVIFASRLYFASVDGYLYCTSLGGEPVWKSDIGRGVHGLYSSPAAESSYVFLGSKDGALYGVDAISGAIKWSYQTNGAVRSSPAVSNGKVYVGSESTFIYGLTSTGQELWKFKTAGNVNSSPAISNGIVYVGCDDHQLYALDGISGEKRWSHDMGSSVYSSPYVANGVVYVGSKNGIVKALSTGGF